MSAGAKRFSCENASRRNSAEYVDVQKILSHASCQCILCWRWFRSGLRCRGRRAVRRACRGLCPAVATACDAAHGLCRASAHGRRLHRVPVQRWSGPAGTAQPAAARLFLRAASTDAAADGAAAGSLSAGRGDRSRASCDGSEICATDGGLHGQGARRHCRRRYAEQVSLSCAVRWPCDALRHWRRQARLYLGRCEDHHREEGMAGMDAAGGDAGTPS